MRRDIALILLKAIGPLGAITGLAFTALDIWLSIKLWPNLLAIIVLGPLLVTVALSMGTPVAWVLVKLATLADREVTEEYMAYLDAQEEYAY
jgi:membrane protein required for beta-lactamase induction